MTKRIMSLVLVLVMLMTVMTACGDKPDTSNPVDNSSDVSTSSDLVSDENSEPLGPDVSTDETGTTTAVSNGDTQTTKAPVATKKPAGNNAAKAPYEMPFEKPVTFTLFLAEHPSQPIKTDAMKWGALTELTNVTLDVDFVAQSQAANKLSAATASGQMYDITWMQYMWLRNMKNSVFMDITNVVEKECPNYWNLVGKDQDLNLYRVFGKYLGFSMYVNQDVKTPYEDQPITTAIRKDVLDDANLKIPTTWNEWFDVMKALKKKYPNSTPFSGRAMNYITNYMAVAMTGYQYSIEYNGTLKKYTCGALQNSFRPLLQFMKQCYDEGILDPNFDKVTAATFLEAATSNKMFFWIDNGVNLYTQNNAMQATNKKAEFVQMNLMKSHLNNNKKAGLAYTQSTNYATLYCLSATSKNKTELLHFMDWCYTDEGMLLNNCGKQGVTYELNADGTPYAPKSVWSKFEKNAMPEYAFMSNYGFGQLCFAPRVLGGDGFEWKGRAVDEDAEDAAYEKQKNADLKAGCYAPSLPLQPDVDSSMQSRIVTLNKYISHQMVKFIKGTRPLSEYNAFVAELKKMGIEDVITACNKNLNG